MKLEYEQRLWLLNLIHHPKRSHWLTNPEVDMVTMVLENGSYGDSEQIKLKNIRDYYIKHTDWKGTMDNPK